MITTYNDVVNAIKRCGIRNFDINITEASQTIHVSFNRVHWYSFILKTRINKVKRILRNEAPIHVFWDFKTLRN